MISDLYFSILCSRYAKQKWQCVVFLQHHIMFGQPHNWYIVIAKTNYHQYLANIFSGWFLLLALLQLNWFSCIILSTKHVHIWDNFIRIHSCCIQFVSIYIMLLFSYCNQYELLIVNESSYMTQNESNWNNKMKWIIEWVDHVMQY